MLLGFFGGSMMKLACSEQIEALSMDTTAADA